MIDNSFAYARSMHPDRVVIGGCRLMPFMLGHAILLTRLKSPISKIWTGETEDMSINVGDAALALWICSRPATDAFRSVAGWWATRSVRRIAKRISRDERESAISQLVGYVVQGFEGPRIRRESDSTTCGAPMLAMLNSGLIAHFHKSDAEALNTPLAYALWNRAALLEERGVLRVWTEADEELVDLARDLEQHPEKIRELFPDEEGGQSDVG